MYRILSLKYLIFWQDNLLLYRYKYKMEKKQALVV